MSELIEEIGNYYQLIIESEEQNTGDYLTFDSEDNLKEIMKIILILNAEELSIVRTILSKSYASATAFRNGLKPYSHFKILYTIIKKLQVLKYNVINLDENIKTETVYKFRNSIEEFYKRKSEENVLQPYDYHMLKQKDDNLESISAKDIVSTTSQIVYEENSIKIIDESTSNENLITLPEELTEKETSNLIEGAKKYIVVNSYERNSKARQECIQYYGAKCYICEFNFGEIYGENGDGFIHVHHEIPLYEIDDEYKVDPIKDLKPVCPNCHAMIHRKRPAYSIQAIKNFINKNKDL